MTIFESFKEQSMDLFGSVQELNQLVIDKFEEASKFQLENVSYYNDLGIKQLRALAEVSDLESAKEFASAGMSLTSDVAKKVMEDSKTVMAMSSDLGEKVKEVISTEAKTAAKPAAKKTAAKAAA